MTVVNWLSGFTSPTTALSRAVRRSEQGKLREAFTLFARAAKAGLPEAEYRVARCYLEGTGVPPSRVEGVRWLERAATHGHVESQALLAALAVHGLAGIKPAAASQPGGLFVAEEQAGPDFQQALTWARRAAEAGSPQGQAMLGYVLTHGPEAMRDLEAAHRWYACSAAAGCAEGCLGYALSLSQRRTDPAARREVAENLQRAAEANLPTAVYLLAVLAEEGMGAEPDPAGAVQLYRKAAEMGVRSAQLRWGLALLEGRHVPQDLVNGESWLRRAAIAGDAEAAALVGDLNVSSSSDLPPNYAQAASWYRRAAEGGHKEAARALASLYLSGTGVAQDSEEAARWLRVSAAEGDQSSQVDLANLVLEGGGSPEDPARIAAWFQQAAAAGDLAASFNLGLCLAKGVGVDQDEAQAAQWIRQAAEGVPQAQYIYGRMLAEGRGVGSDPEQARAWFARAADSGIVDAQVALAEMMVNGRGGPEDAAGARALFEKAAEEGHVGAMFALGALHSGGHQQPMDRAEAERWFRAAAERGHAYAQLMLGRYLAAGATGEPRPDEARLWLERALAQEIDEARQDLAALAAEAEERSEQPKRAVVI
jgi:TPR repeat protein